MIFLEFSGPQVSRPLEAQYPLEQLNYIKAATLLFLLLLALLARLTRLACTAATA